MLRVHHDEQPLRLDEAHVLRDELLRIEDRNILSRGPTIAHVPKFINRDFRDKTRVFTLRG